MTELEVCYQLVRQGYVCAVGERVHGKGGRYCTILVNGSLRAGVARVCGQIVELSTTNRDYVRSFVLSDLCDEASEEERQ